MLSCHTEICLSLSGGTEEFKMVTENLDIFNLILFEEEVDHGLLPSDVLLSPPLSLLQ